MCRDHERQINVRNLANSSRSITRAKLAEKIAKEIYEFLKVGIAVLVLLWEIMQCLIMMFLPSDVGPFLSALGRTFMRMWMLHLFLLGER